MAQYVSYAERAFLHLMGRRLLKYTREAEERGEKYNDMSSFSPLPCGVSAKFRFEVVPSGYAPVVFLKEMVPVGPGKLKEIATEILDAPVKLRASKDDVLEYVREMDAGTSV